MGRRKKLENQAEAIVDASMKLFGQYGYAKTTLEDIAREVGIGKATVYSDFCGKDEILLAVIDRINTQMLNNMRDGIRDSASGRLETLREVLLQDFLLFHDIVRQHHSDFYSLQETVHILGERLQEARRTTREKKQHMMAEVLEKAALEGEIQPVEDYFHLARMVWMCLEGMFHTHFNRSREENREMALQVLDIALSGLKLPRNSLDMKAPVRADDRLTRL